MKKLILLLVLTFVICGCTPTNEDGSLKLDTGNMNNPHIVIVDSCEYIRWNYGFTHKGNCKYCAERRKKEQEELIRKIKEQ